MGEDGRSRDRSRPAVPDPLPMSVVDAHCHLDIADGEDGAWLSPAEAIKLASSVGVTRIVQVGCDLPGAAWAVEAATQYPNLIAGVALHPNEAPKLKEAGELDSALAEIERLASSSDKVRVIGETGLDYFRTGEDGRTAQHESFAAHIELAKRLDKTLMIHDRDAHEDILRILDREGVPDRLVMHCFSGDTEFARECVNRGAFLSFAGVVTFKNAQSLRDALAVTPLDRILVETDAPYLTPSRTRQAQRVVPDPPHRPKNGRRPQPLGPRTLHSPQQQRQPSLRRSLVMVQYDDVDAQVLGLADSLQGADEATVGAEVARLKTLAEQIADERSRQLALIRVQKLPELIRGPRPGTSPEYWRASTVLAQVINDKGSPAEQIAHAERAIAEIGELSRQAPLRESRTILRMNSTLKRLIDRRRREGLEGGS